jgi:glycosyltransferase involved in cell wall biosynthesis
MARAGIVASPSLYEPFGLAALEGALAGAALVLSDIPTYRELWDEAALFAPAGDPDALRHALNRLARDTDLRLELRQKARARATQFSPAAQATQMRAIYRDLLHARAGALSLAS